MIKLGYTWYPKDWGNSDSVFELNLSERGLYRELIDLAMLHDNKAELKPNIWARKFGSSDAEIAEILEKLKRLGLVEIKGESIFIPSCESRLNLVRGGSKGGKKSKPTPKPTPKPFGSLEEKNEKPTPKQIETKIEIETKREKKSIEAEPKHKLIIWLEANCPSVQKMKQPITNDQAVKIEKDFKDNKPLVVNTFRAMENKPDLQKKYKSANLTFRTWAKNDFGNNTNTKSKSKRWSDPSEVFMCIDWIERIPKPPPREDEEACREFKQRWRISELRAYQYEKDKSSNIIHDYEE